MIIEFLLLAFVVAFLRGGSFRKLNSVQLDKLWLAFIPLLMVAAVEIARNFGFESEALHLSGPLHILSLVPLLALLWFNRKISGTALIALGVFINIFPIVSNGGRMPVSIPMARVANIGPALDAYAEGKPMSRHCVMTGETRFNWLADYIPVPRPPFLAPTVVSPGDLILTLGMCIFIQALMGASLRKTGDEQNT